MEPKVAENPARRTDGSSQTDSSTWDELVSESKSSLDDPEVRRIYLAALEATDETYRRIFLDTQEQRIELIMQEAERQAKKLEQSENYKRKEEEHVR